MSINRRMDKQNVYTYNGTLLSLKEEKKTDTWHSMDEPWRNYAKWNKPVAKRPIQWFHLHEVPGVITLIQTESKKVVARGWKKGRTESYCLIGSIYLFCKSQNSFAKMWFLFEFSVPPLQTSCEQSCFWAYPSCLFVPLNRWKQWIQDSNPRQLQCSAWAFQPQDSPKGKGSLLKSTQPICPQSITNAICNSDYSRHHKTYRYMASLGLQDLTDWRTKQTNCREGWFIRESKWPCALVKYLYNCDSACLYLVKILWQRNRRRPWLLEMSFKFKMETCNTFT